MIKNWRTFLILTFCCHSLAQAAPNLLMMEPEGAPLIVEITPVVILNAAAPTQKQNNGSLSWTGNVATGFGLLTSFSLFDTPFDLETGAVYMNQTSERNTATGTVLTQNSHNLHIPLLLRFNFDDRVGIGFGAYTSFGSGSITTTQNNTNSYTSYNSAGIHNRDFGLLFSARASLKILNQFYFIVDGRYQHGLTNLANIPPGSTGDVLNTRSMQAYLGLSYRFMPF